MFIKKDSNFPYRLVITQGSQRFDAQLSLYRAAQTYDITFQQGGAFDTLRDLVLNGAILDLYEDDPDLSPSQNRRFGTITVALGLWGSLAASMEKTLVEAIPLSIRGIFSSSGKEVSRIFNTVAAVAAVVAYVAVPVASFIDPAPLSITREAVTSAPVVSTELSAVLATAAGISAAIADEPPPPQLTELRVTYEGQPITNGVEFHISKGQDVLLNFSSPGLDNTTITSLNFMREPYEPGVIGHPNDYFFRDISIIKDGNSDEFKIRIKRKDIDGYIGNGKISFGFQFASPVTTINDSTTAVQYKKPGDTSEMPYRDIVVVRFCIDPDCPDYR
jgi:hypothetical protein